MAPVTYTRLSKFQRLSEPYSTVRRPLRDAGTEIKTDESQEQNASTLFALPAEIRTLIFEYVVGSGVVHVRERECEQFENWTVIRRYKEFSTAILEQFRFVDFPTKLTYSTCRMPLEWDARYALSKRAAPKKCFDRNGSITIGSSVGSSDEALHDYVLSHHPCLRDALRDYRSGDYQKGCSAQHPETLKMSGCTACEAQYNRWMAAYGPAPQNLKKFHASTGVDLQLLLACRQAYKEAWHLPYIQYTFDLPNTRGLMSDFAQRLLYPHQRKLIESLHIIDFGLYSEGSPVNLFPALRTLQLSHHGEDGRTRHRDYFTGLVGDVKLKSVEVIIGYDMNDYDRRLGNRIFAELIEETLLDE